MYDTLGRVGQKSLANGTSEHYAYDTRSRLTQVQLKQGATVLRTTGYAWDNADQITSQTVNGVTTNYGYDLAGQLTSEVRSGYNVAYTYDANGNRLSKTVNGTVESYTYDLADKMLTAGAKSYTYDAAGRTVSINAPGGTTTLSYDYESRVTAIAGPGINETHTYNGLDTRVGTVQGGVSRTFVRDGSYVTDPVLRDGQATYTPGVSERRGGVSTWSHSGLKNADAQTSSVGAIAATRVYDAFGAELSATGTWKGPFGYAGGFGYQEDSSGLKLLGHRYYDPTTGRFLSRDRAKDGRNWYVYCNSNPLSNIDAQGYRSVWIGSSAGIIGIGPSGSVSVSIGLDLDTWRIGVRGEVGGGYGVGNAKGWTPWYGAYDHTGTINGNGPNGTGTTYTTGPIVVFAIVVASIEFATGGGGLTGLSVGPGSKHGQGAGIAVEHRAGYQLDVIQGIMDLWSTASARAMEAWGRMEDLLEEALRGKLPTEFFPTTTLALE